MNILAFDTSSHACSVALECNHQVKLLHQVAPMQHAKLILPMIQELLDAFSIKLQDLDAIAYGCGPGSFTGLRIGSSVVQGLSVVAECPIISVSSLAILAQTAYLTHQWRHLLVAVDARMDQLYWANYAVNSKGYVELAGQEILTAPEKIPIPLNPQDCYGIGDGWGKYKDKLAQQLGLSSINLDAAQSPMATALLQLAHVKFAASDFISPEEAIPTYLR